MAKTTKATKKPDLVVSDPASAARPAIRQVVVDISRMTIGDIALLDEFREIAEQKRKGRDVQMPIGRMITFMDRIVEGGISDLPATSLSDVMEVVSQAVSDMMSRAQGSDDPEKN